MNKQEWLECTNLKKMHRQITDQRKLRLFACAVARQFWHLFEEPSKNAVIVGERFADGEATEQELDSAFNVAYSDAIEISNQKMFEVRNAAYVATHCAARSFGIGSVVRDAINAASWSGPYSDVTKYHRNLLREIVNPYHIPTIYPKLAIEIAQDIYKKQDFTGTPVLADALEEHDIMDQELLEHLRGKGHVRGCWAIDVIRTA